MAAILPAGPAPTTTISYFSIFPLSSRIFESKGFAIFFLSKGIISSDLH
jgi:hypothetical protein